MHAPSIWGILIVLLLAFILFGRPGKLSGFMTDLGAGIKGFRKGLGEKEEDDAKPAPPQEPPRQIPDKSRVDQGQRDRSGV